MDASNAQAALFEGEWEGEGELWLDPDSDEVTLLGCTASSAPHAIEYKWFYDDVQHRGRLRWTKKGGTFQDTLHLPEEAPCQRKEVPGTLVVLTCDAPGADATWEVSVTLPAKGKLVVQVTRVEAEDDREPVTRLTFDEADDEDF